MLLKDGQLRTPKTRSCLGSLLRFHQVNGWSLSQTITNYFHGPDGMQCQTIDDSLGNTAGCAGGTESERSESGHAAG
jgi:hypothetical protein